MHRIKRHNAINFAIRVSSLRDLLADSLSFWGTSVLVSEGVNLVIIHLEKSPVNRVLLQTDLQSSRFSAFLQTGEPSETESFPTHGNARRSSLSYSACSRKTCRMMYLHRGFSPCKDGFIWSHNSFLDQRFREVE